MSIWRRSPSICFCCNGEVLVSMAARSFLFCAEAAAAGKKRESFIANNPKKPQEPESH